MVWKDLKIEDWLWLLRTAFDTWHTVTAVSMTGLDRNDSVSPKSIINLTLQVSNQHDFPTSLFQNAGYYIEPRDLRLYASLKSTVFWQKMSLIKLW